MITFDEEMNKLSPERRAKIEAKTQELLQEVQILNEIRHKFSKLTENFGQERQAEIAQKTDKLKAEIILHELRQSLKIDQSEARKTQEYVNQYINHLRQVIESMGGTLDITIHLDNKDILINNFDELIDNSCSQ